jgi:hypothetical protein
MRQRLEVWPLRLGAYERRVFNREQRDVVSVERLDQKPTRARKPEVELVVPDHVDAPLRLVLRRGSRES